MNRCKLCHKNIPDPIPEVGSNTPYEMQIVTALSMHIATEHPDVDQALQLSTMSVLGVARLSQYEYVSNKEVAERVTYAKWNLLQANHTRLTEKEIDAFATAMLKTAGREDTPANRTTCKQFIRTIVSRCFELDKYVAETASKVLKPV